MRTPFLEDARVLQQTGYDGGQFVLRVEAPKCAAHAEPGSFVHLTSDPAFPIQRPLPIMRADASGGWIEMLYQVGEPGAALAGRKPGEHISTLGPIGRGFTPHPARPLPLLIGGGVGIAPMIFLADRLRLRMDAQWKPLVLMGSEVPFPFRTRPSQIVVQGIPDGAIASMPLLEEWGIASRLATQADFPGCFDGYVTELAAHWLEALSPAGLGEVEMFACGPTPMLEATAQLARQYSVPCQAVCVDGPVFDAYSIF